jgi:hypothetical protein
VRNAHSTQVEYMLTTALSCSDPAIEEECLFEGYESRSPMGDQARADWIGSDRIQRRGPSLGCSDAMGPSKLAQPVTVLTCIREVRGSKFSWDTNYPDCHVFAGFLSLPRQMLKLCQDCFFTHFFDNNMRGRVSK